MNVNDEFLKEFKKLDKLLSDAYGEIHGVTAYLNDMTEKGIGGYDYQQLKTLRNVRNKLIHEVGYEDIARITRSDIAYLNDFYKRFLRCEDPLAELRKRKQNIRTNASGGYKTNYKEESFTQLHNRKNKNTNEVGCIVIGVLILLIFSIGVGILVNLYL